MTINQANKQPVRQVTVSSLRHWRPWLAIVLGSLLYGGLSWVTNFSAVSGAFDGNLRPGVAIPIVFGFIYGPFVGFMVGFLGNLGLDYSSGFLSYPPDPATGNLLRDVVAGYFLNWQIGNGIFGLIPGLWSRWQPRYDRTRDLLAALGVTTVAIVAGVAFAALIDILLFDYVDLNFAIQQELIPISIVNLINALILTPIILFNYTHLNYRALPSIRSGLMRRLLITLLISGALPVGLLGLFLFQQTTGAAASPSGLLIKLAITVLFTLLFTVVNALLVAQTVSAPLLRLAEAARLMEAEQLRPEHIEAIQAMQGNDEVTQLGHVFARMAAEVIARERKLQKQVQELRIEIDRVRQEQAVSEITDTEYFQDLQQKVNQLRGRSRRPRSSSQE
ncbi:MAG: hypothetical protein KF832_02810 [Caldilineaceae bacterium]|nr:hypothetical protein [Caldilineaceae bacterium]